MQEIARRSHAICQSFLTVRRVASVAARRSTALVFMRTLSTQSRFSDVPRFGWKGRPARVAMAWAEPLMAWPWRSTISRRGGLSRLMRLLLEECQNGTELKERG